MGICSFIQLSNQSRCSGGFVLPRGREDSVGLVVPSQSVDSALNQDETELGVTILPIPLQVLPDGYCLLD